MQSYRKYGVLLKISDWIRNPSLIIGQMASERLRVISKRSITTSVDTDSDCGSKRCVDADSDCGSKRCVDAVSDCCSERCVNTDLTGVDTDSDCGSESDNSILLATDNDTNVKSKPIPAKRQKTRRLCGSAQVLD